MGAKPSLAAAIRQLRDIVDDLDRTHDAWRSAEEPPTDEAQVLVFRCGDRPVTAKRPPDANWGLEVGWFDQDGRYWRVGGRPERYVTHWMPLPPDPPTARDKPARKRTRKEPSL